MILRCESDIAPWYNEMIILKLKKAYDAHDGDEFGEALEELRFLLRTVSRQPIKPKQLSWHAGMDAQLKALRSQGHEWKPIAVAMGLKLNQVHRRGKKLGLTRIAR